jgi:hypothetical protein
VLHIPNPLKVAILRHCAYGTQKIVNYGKRLPPLIIIVQIKAIHMLKFVFRYPYGAARSYTSPDSKETTISEKDADIVQRARLELYT